MIDLGRLQFVSGWALLLLLLLPIWWIWRYRRPRPAIVFSRTASLAERAVEQLLSQAGVLTLPLG